MFVTNEISLAGYQVTPTDPAAQFVQQLWSQNTDGEQDNTDCFLVDWRLRLERASDVTIDSVEKDVENLCGLCICFLSAVSSRLVLSQTSCQRNLIIVLLCMYNV